MSDGWLELDSSLVSAIRHDGLDLFIRFKNGTIGRYKGVPDDVYAQMMNAPSAGKYFLAYIKGQYPHSRG